MAVQILLKRDTGSNWASANTVLGDGEIGINTTTYQFKIGNGSTAWNSLSYAPISGTVADIDEITNVVITSAADGQILKYNGTNWVNVTFNELIALTGLSDVTITSVASGNILKYNGSAWVNSSTSELIPLGDLSDVTITSAANKDFLMYNGTAWVDSPIPFDDLSDVTITSAATSDLIKWNGTAFVNVAMNDTYTSSVTTTAATANAVRLAYRDAILNFTMEVI